MGRPQGGRTLFFFLCKHGFVFIRGHQIIRLCRIRKINLHEPPILVWTLVDHLRSVLYLIVNLGNGAAHGCIYVRNSLNRLHLSIRRICGELRACLRHLDEDYVSYRILSIVSDSEYGSVSVSSDPVMFLVILELLGVHACSFLSHAWQNHHSICLLYTSPSPR